ncbi:MAG TPA: tripartite tricarboxylate transporter permease [Pseudolabrys sp.]|jgi:putative tricarboxylic transport membrane protein|nr:tripartite tricarboxylate transporter permease [Pseudolabrys sp.]
MFDATLQAFLHVLIDPVGLGLCVIGVVVGIILGALPGISSTMSLAVLLPFSFGMDLDRSMLFLMAVFSASVYGGSISAILINIPGTPGAIVTQMDGYPMARKGRAGEALTYALLASTLGGIFGWLLLIGLAPVVASVALVFQSPEFAAITLFGLTMLAYASPGSTFLGIIGGIIGLLVATVGFDPTTDVSRFTFGIAPLQAGLGLIPAAVGIFGVAEVLQNIEHSGPRLKMITEIKRILPPWDEAKRLWPICIRGSLIGAFVGAIPAAGSAIAVSLSYAQEKRMSRNPERFGTGIPEGIVAPESANNSCVGGALIPMITLGIPGDSMTAVLIGALLIHGLRPGPDMFRSHLDFVAIVYVSLFLAVVVTLVLGLYGNRYFARVLQLPRPMLLTAVMLLCIVGSFAVRNSLFDVVVMLGFGVVGYLMNRVGMPTAPVIFGMVLGPLLEDNIRRSLILYGNWSAFVERPISLALILLSLAALVYPLIQIVWTKRRTT